MVGTLELLVAENYLLVHLNGGTSRAQVPPLSWIRQCYRTLDRRWASEQGAMSLFYLLWFYFSFVNLHPFPSFHSFYFHLVLPLFCPSTPLSKPVLSSVLSWDQRNQVSNLAFANQLCDFGFVCVRAGGLVGCLFLSALWLWTSHLTFLGLSFLICNMKKYLCCWVFVKIK